MIFKRSQALQYPLYHPSTNHQTLVEVEKSVAERMARAEPDIGVLGISVDDVPFFLRRQA